MALDDLPGSMGTSAGFALRLGQTIFSSASLFFMAYGVQFYSYSSFCFLVTIMGLVIPWSFTLAMLDGYSVLVTCPIRQKGILLIVVIGDWVLSILTLGAASSGASVVDILMRADGSFLPFKYLQSISTFNNFCFLVMVLVDGFLAIQSMASSIFVIRIFIWVNK